MLAFLRDSKPPKCLRRTFLFLLPIPLISSRVDFVRDESHRFALSRSKKRRKNLTKSTLDEIKGIGSKNKKVLLRHFGGLESLRKASIDQIESIEGIGSIRAKLIYDYLNEK